MALLPDVAVLVQCTRGYGAICNDVLSYTPFFCKGFLSFYMTDVNAPDGVTKTVKKHGCCCV